MNRVAQEPAQLTNVPADAVGDVAALPPSRHVARTSAAEDIGAGATPSRFVLVDQAYQDYCRRREQGEPLDPDAYCDRFPAMKSSLGRLLQAHQFLEENERLFADAPEVHWPEAGETFLDYDLKLELGKGAFARVFLATEPKLGNRLVAVKIALHGAAEAEVLGRIQHPNIVPVHSVHEDKASGLTAVCMPYLGSATLCDVQDSAFAPPSTNPTSARVILDTVKQLPFPLDPAQRSAPHAVLRNGTYVDGIRLIGARLAQALAFIHDRGIDHRDLKPSNVLMSPEGVPMLLDFNLCADAAQTLNRLGGTMLYMSPEQLRATALDPSMDATPLDARSDLFSLGVILYELVTGQHPFGPVPLKLSSAELRSYLLERQEKGPIEACQIAPRVDAGFSALIQRCLAHDPARRPQTATEIAVALERGLAPLPRAKRWITRHPYKTVAVAFLIAVLSVASVAVAALRVPPSERPIDAGMRLYQDGRYREAVAHLNDALYADPNNDAARFTRAHAHLHLGELNLAIQGFQEADARNPSGRTKALLAHCFNRTGIRPEAALANYRDAIKFGFATAAVHNNIGFNLLKINQLKEARASLDEAIRLDPKLQAAYHNRARAAFAQTAAKINELVPDADQSDTYRGLKAGIADAKKAIDLGPPSAELYFDTARLMAFAARVEQRWVGASVENLQQSVDAGLDPRMCRDPAFKGLEQDPTFQKLLSRPATGRPLPPTTRIVDPASASAR